MSEPISPAVVSDFHYEQLFSGVHVLTFRSYSHEAADQCYEAFVTIFRVTMPGETARILVDTSLIRHLNPSIIAAVAKRIMDARAPVPPRTVAIVLNPKSMFLVLSGVIRRMAGAYGVPVYIGTSYDEALAWLESGGRGQVQA